MGPARCLSRGLLLADPARLGEGKRPVVFIGGKRMGESATSGVALAI